MHAFTVVSLSKDDRRQIERLIPSLVLAFSDRDDADSADSGHWQTIKRLAQPDWLWSEENIATLGQVLDAAEQTLRARAERDYWQLNGEPLSAPPGAAAPDAVLAEAAQAALANVAELREWAQAIQTAVNTGAVAV